MAADYEYYCTFTGRNDYTTEEQAQITLYLEYAEQLILAYTGGLWNFQGKPTIADGRQAHIVRKYFNNQLGITSESADGFSQAYDERSYEGLRLTSEDKKILDSIKAGNGVGSITTVSLHRNWGYAW